MLLFLLAAAAPGKERAALQADLDSLATTLDSMLGHFAAREATPLLRAQRSDPSNGAAMLATLNQERRRRLSAVDGYASLLGVSQALTGDGGLPWFINRLKASLQASVIERKKNNAPYHDVVTLIKTLDQEGIQQAVGASIAATLRTPEFTVTLKDGSVRKRANPAYVDPDDAANIVAAVPNEDGWVTRDPFDLDDADPSDERQLLKNLYLAFLDIQPMGPVFVDMTFKEFYEGWNADQ